MGKQIWRLSCFRVWDNIMQQAAVCFFVSLLEDVNLTVSVCPPAIEYKTCAVGSNLLLITKCNK